MSENLKDVEEELRCEVRRMKEEEEELRAKVTALEDEVKKLFIYLNDIYDYFTVLRKRGGF